MCLEKQMMLSSAHFCSEAIQSSCLEGLLNIQLPASIKLTASSTSHDKASILLIQMDAECLNLPLSASCGIWLMHNVRCCHLYQMTASYIMHQPDAMGGRKREVYRCSNTLSYNPPTMSQCLFGIL